MVNTFQLPGKTKNLKEEQNDFTDGQATSTQYNDVWLMDVDPRQFERFS